MRKIAAKSKNSMLSLVSGWSLAASGPGVVGDILMVRVTPARWGTVFRVFRFTACGLGSRPRFSAFASDYGYIARRLPFVSAGISRVETLLISFESAERVF